MMLHHKMTLLTKMEELDAYAHHVLLQFPKYERHVLCAEIRGAMNAALRYAIRAGKQYHKKTTLQDLDIQVEVMRSLVRKAHALKYITTHRYQVWSGHINEIGAMVGGWVKKERS